VKGTGRPGAKIHISSGVLSLSSASSPTGLLAPLVASSQSGAELRVAHRGSAGAGAAAGAGMGVSRCACCGAGLVSRGGDGVGSWQRVVVLLAGRELRPGDRHRRPGLRRGAQRAGREVADLAARARLQQNMSMSRLVTGSHHAAGMHGGALF
jgi:hypothetical protein